MNHRIFNTKSTLLIFLSTILFTVSPGMAQDPVNQSVPVISSAGGIRTVTFLNPAGKIKVLLPEDMAAGDTISGTVSTEPAGKNDAEKEKNQGVLNGYVIDLGGGDKVKADTPRFSWTPHIPQASTGVKYVLKIVETLGPNGTAVSTAEFPINTTAPTTPTQFTIPVLGQTGRPVPITGPFDGNSSDTKCTIGGQESPVIVESPRQAIIRAPTGFTGLTEIKVNEGNATATGQFRNVGVNLTAPKTSLLKNEKTPVNLLVSGLKGITVPVPLQLVTTGPVETQGGNTQNLQIKPNQVQTNGEFSRSFELTGVSAGNFKVTGTVITGGPTTGDNKCNCVCEFATPPIVPSGSGNASRTGHYSWKPSMAKSGCTGSHCTVKSTEYAWSIGSGSTATYTVVGGKSGQELTVDVTGDGTLELTVTVTVTCSDGTTCKATGSKTFDVKK